MSKQSYLPRKDAELVAWSDNFIAQVAASAAAWTIPTTEVTELQTALANFKQYYAQADSPKKSSIIVSQKNATRARLETKIRAMVNFRLQNPVITASQRIAMGLHVRDTSPTTIPVPSTRPELDIDVLDVRRLSVVFHDQGKTSKAKPYGVNGAVISYAVRSTPPGDVNDLIHSTLATRTPHTLAFSEEERGKTVYVAIQWQNEKGEKGPWSEIEHAIIP
jgi:hypothetical protein